MSAENPVTFVEKRWRLGLRCYWDVFWNCDAIGNSYTKDFNRGGAVIPGYGLRYVAR